LHDVLGALPETSLANAPSRSVNVTAKPSSIGGLDRMNPAQPEPNRSKSPEF